MNIAIFADVHGRILLLFKLCARWQRETGERIDLVLQAGDLGVYPDESRLDRATIRHAQDDPSELGFARDFVQARDDVAAVLGQTSFPLIFVRGNHEDHGWLDQREAQAAEPIFAIDAYERIFCLKTGIPYTFRKADEQVTLLGIGRIGAPPGAKAEAKYIQPDESLRLHDLDNLACDLLLTHDVALDFVSPNQGMEEIGLVVGAAYPIYHFHGHTEEPYTYRTYNSGIPAIKLADLHWTKTKALEPGAMGMLRWQDRDHHRFEVVDSSWLSGYNARTWRIID